MHKTDKIAILMATYNGEKYIKEQIESLLNQTCSDWVLFIHDDGSSDNTNNILKEYAEKYPEKITIIENSATGGARNNFFFLLKSVEAPLYMFCDQDDVWLPDKIEKERAMYIEHESIEKPVLVFTDLVVVDENLNKIAPSLWEYFKFETDNIKVESLILQNVITGCTMLINKKLRNMMIKYKNIDNIPMHDKWGAMIALEFGKLCKINSQTILYRQHNDNSIGVKTGSGISYIMSKIYNLSKLKGDYEYTRRQAIEFCDIFRSENDTLIAYASSNNMSKLKRLAIYYKYKIKTNRPMQNLGLLICG